MPLKVEKGYKCSDFPALAFPAFVSSAGVSGHSELAVNKLCTKIPLFEPHFTASECKESKISSEHSRVDRKICKLYSGAKPQNENVPWAYTEQSKYKVICQFNRIFMNVLYFIRCNCVFFLNF